MQGGHGGLRVALMTPPREGGQRKRELVNFLPFSALRLPSPGPASYDS